MTDAPLEGPAERSAADLAEVVRTALAAVGGLHPAVADDALISRVPGVDEAWISGPEDELTVRVVTTPADLPARTRLVQVRGLLRELLGVPVRLVLVDVVTTPPDDSVDEVRLPGLLDP